MAGGGASVRIHRRPQQLSFRAVNRPGQDGYRSDLQRHHLLPRQVLHIASLQRMLRGLGHKSVGFHDFHRNGILLPARDSAVLRLGLPLHCGPHRAYNEMVIERLGMIEQGWSSQSLRSTGSARAEALMRIGLLQSALRRRILDTGRPLRFNRRDPLGAGRDFTVLDRLAEQLWVATAASV